MAEYSLVWIYIDYEEPEKAVELASKSIDEYNDSRFFKWGLARAYNDIDKKKAILVYSDILKSVETIKEQKFV